ncbi:MAG TPA: signal peptidase I [Gaiellaceae bacterium]|nr:signal peptidase I [Gaiellaceae bacterium]
MGLGLAIFVLVLLGLLPHTGWYRTETVLSGSMKPAFAPGDLIVVRPERLGDVRVGQMISYHIPVGDHHVQTHRVIAVVRRSGKTLVRTKGDANNAADPWLAELHGTTAWRVQGVVPKAGWGIVWLRSPHVRTLAVFGLPLLLALFGLWRIWRAPGAGGSNEAHDAARSLG